MGSWRHKVVQACNRVLHPIGSKHPTDRDLARLERIESRFFPIRGASFQEGALPPGAEEYLKPDNPRLLEIKKRYKAMNCPATRHSVWGGQVGSIDLRYFRGDNPYVYQFLQGNSELAHILTAHYLKTMDSLGLLDRLKRRREIWRVRSCSMSASCLAGIYWIRSVRFCFLKKPWVFRNYRG